MRRAVLPLTIVLWLAAGTATAGAQRFAAATDDPRDAGAAALPDIARVVTEFDAEAGTWALTVRFHRPLPIDRRPRLLGALRLRDAAGACTTGPVVVFATQTSLRSGANAYAPFTERAGFMGGAKGLSPDGRELTLWFQHNRMRGRQPCAADDVRVTLAGASDGVASLPFAASTPSRTDRVRPVAGLTRGEYGLRVLSGGRVRGVVVGEASERGVVAVVELLRGRSRLGVRRVRLSVDDVRTVDVRVPAAVARRLRARPRYVTSIRLRLVDGAGNRSVAVELNGPLTGGAPA